MDAAQKTPSMDRLRHVAAEVRRRGLQWRTGADSSPGFTAAVEELPQDTLNAVHGLALGDVAAPDAIRQLAARLDAVLSAAGELDNLCAAWASARAHVPGDPEELPEAALDGALHEADAGRATTLWRAVREALEPMARTEAVHASTALAAKVRDEEQVAGANAFLKATRDLWQDASEDMSRRALAPAGIPSMARAARALVCPPLEEGLSTAASRHVARQSVQHLLEGQGITLRRLSVRPWAYLAGVAVLGEDRMPRVGWVERRGAPAALELVGLTVGAALWALRPQLSSEAAIQLVSCAAQLGALMTPVVRAGFQLSGDDAWKVQRHGAFALLRQARVRAALAAARPADPREAMDALASATQQDPDVVEAAALLAPFPDGSPFTSLGPLRVGRNWLAQAGGGAFAEAAMQSWDEDFLGRPVAQQALAALMEQREGTPDALGALGAKPDATGAALHRLLERWLG